MTAIDFGFFSDKKNYYYNLWIFVLSFRNMIYMSLIRVKILKSSEFKMNIFHNKELTHFYFPSKAPFVKCIYDVFKGIFAMLKNRLSRKNFLSMTRQIKTGV